MYRIRVFLMYLTAFAGGWLAYAVTHWAAGAIAVTAFLLVYVLIRRWGRR